MERAQKRNSIQQEKFYFRKNNKISEMTMDEIINGSVSQQTNHFSFFHLFHLE